MSDAQAFRLGYCKLCYYLKRRLQELVNKISNIISQNCVYFFSVVWRGAPVAGVVSCGVVPWRGVEWWGVEWYRRPRATDPRPRARRQKELHIAWSRPPGLKSLLHCSSNFLLFLGVFVSCVLSGVVCLGFHFRRLEIVY